MTEDEKRQQKAMLLLECEEAESDLAHLRERAARLSGEIGEVEAWLNRAAPFHGNRELTQKDIELDKKIRAKQQVYRDALSFDSALSLMDEITAAQKRFADIAERKSNLRLK
jgi:hypothetical protein